MPRVTAMLNVRDECDLPEDDGYDLFTRETEVERHATTMSRGSRRGTAIAKAGG